MGRILKFSFVVVIGRTLYKKRCTSAGDVSRLVMIRACMYGIEAIYVDVVDFR